jgi:hypothetical protein
MLYVNLRYYTETLCAYITIGQNNIFVRGRGLEDITYIAVIVFWLSGYLLLCITLCTRSMHTATAMCSQKQCIERIRSVK